jgi:acyl-ACP thioesterase
MPPSSQQPDEDRVVHSERYQVRSYEVDQQGRLQIATFLNYLQETAGGHVLVEGLESTDLLAREQTWVLARLELEVVDRPGWRDEVLVHTWASGYHGRLLARREFLVEDPGGSAMARCASAWLYIDIESRRPLRVDRGLLDDFPQREERVLDTELPKLPAHQGEAEEHHFAVRYRDVDVNRHVNNARYVEYLVASLPAPVLVGGELERLEVNFLGEAHLGDRVRARCAAGEGPGHYWHSLQREVDGQELVRARSRWRAD